MAPQNNYTANLMRLPVSASNYFQLLVLLTRLNYFPGAIGTNPLQSVP